MANEFPDFKIELAPDLEAVVTKEVVKSKKPLDIANAIRSEAIATAPRDTGRYADNIVVEETPKGARVFAADQKSAWIEFGIPGRGIPGLFILRRAADSLGLTFTKRSKE
jgi:hypothetical protein